MDLSVFSVILISFVFNMLILTLSIWFVSRISTNFKKEFMTAATNVNEAAKNIVKNAKLVDQKIEELDEWTKQTNKRLDQMGIIEDSYLAKRRRNG